MIDPNNPDAYGPEFLAFVEGFMRVLPEHLRPVFIEAVRCASQKVDELVNNNIDAVALSLFFGFAAGNEGLAPDVLEKIREAFEAGVKGGESARRQRAGVH